VDKYQIGWLAETRKITLYQILFIFKSTKVLPTLIRLSVVNYWTGISAETKRKDIDTKCKRQETNDKNDEV